MSVVEVVAARLPNPMNCTPPTPLCPEARLLCPSDVPVVALVSSLTIWLRCLYSLSVFTTAKELTCGILLAGRTRAALPPLLRRRPMRFFTSGRFGQPSSTCLVNMSVLTVRKIGQLEHTFEECLCAQTHSDTSDKRSCGPSNGPVVKHSQHEIQRKVPVRVDVRFVRVGPDLSVAQISLRNRGTRTHMDVLVADRGSTCVPSDCTHAGTSSHILCIGTWSSLLL